MMTFMEVSARFCAGAAWLINFSDLYGNDDAADFPGFDHAETETKEATKPAPAETVSTPAPVVKSTPPVAEAKPAPIAPVKKEDPKPVPKKEEPLTNPIPTFTEDSGASYSQGGNKYGQSYSHGANGDARLVQGHNMNGGQTPQAIEGVDGGDMRPSTMRDEG
jgi:outer membrane biosynthesis protein TonB